MHSRNTSQNPVFKVLAEIQRYTDVDPNPEDSDFTTCRAMRRDGGRCRNPPCTQYERWHTPSLLSEFQDMTECPDTETFYNKLETFITYSHCKRWHRSPACAAFDRWKRERIAAKSNSRPVTRPMISSARQSRPSPTVQPLTTSVIQPITAAALQQLPSTPTRFVPSSASATSDDGSSFDDSVLESLSETSNTTFLSSLPNTPSRNEPIASVEMEDIVEESSVQENALDQFTANAERFNASAEMLHVALKNFNAFLEKEVAAREAAAREAAAKEAAAKEEAAKEEEALANDKIDVEDVKEEGVKQQDLKEEKDLIEEGFEEETVEDDIVRNNFAKESDVEEMQDPVLTSDSNNTVVDTEESDEMREPLIERLGIISPQRNGSLRDHSPVFRVINSHPTADKMREGVVYILEHKENSSLFKIGWSSKSAEERLHQPNNCYGVNTKVIYETKRFTGAPHAERIAQVILRHANIRVYPCDRCKGGHREWFAAQRETVRQTVMQMEEFVQMPAYTLQDGEYKLSPEAYSHVVKQMCDFSILKMGELMRETRESDGVETLSNVLSETISQVSITPPEVSRPGTRDEFSEMQEANESLISLSSHIGKSKTRLSAGAKVARKLKRFVAAKHSVKEYLTRSRESTPEAGDNDRRAFGSVFVDLKDKARVMGTKARQDVREFRRDFKEELRRTNEEQTL
ncbi:hypothetical protein ACHAQJ_000492 [Trichoderma viride]